MTNLERWSGRLYFLGASGLFLFAVYQVNLTTEILDKQIKMMPAHLQRAFEAGCLTKSKQGCKEAALKFRAEQDRIYN